MEFRYGREKDLEQAKKIWSDCFTDSQEEVDFYFKNLYSQENFLMLEKDKEILASLHENKYTLRICGDEIPSYYIVGVAVLPQFRSKGFMKKLMIESIKGAKTKGYEFIYLCPINSKLYRKYGFEYILEVEKYRFKMDDIVSFNIDKNISIKKIEPNFRNEDIYDLINIYESKMKDFTMYVKRDVETFTKLLKEVYSDSGETYIFYRENRPVGYIIFYRDKKIYVRELFGVDVKTISNILSFIKTFKDYFQEIEVITPEKENFNFYFENQESIEKIVEPFIMGRIIDPIKILKRVADKKFDLKIKISDDVIDENNGVYNCKEDGDIVFEKDGKWDMMLDIGSLSLLLFGYFTLEELIFKGKIIFENANILKKLVEEKVFSTKKSYILDYQ